MKNIEELKKLLKETHDELYKKYADYIEEDGDLYVWKGEEYSPEKLSIDEKGIVVYGGWFNSLHCMFNDDREDVLIASTDINGDYIKDWYKWAKTTIEDIKNNAYVEKRF